jgi:hypothetical protein
VSSSFTADAAFAKFSTARLSHLSHKSVSRGFTFPKLHYRSLALQPADLFALLTDPTRPTPCRRELLLPCFRQDGHPTLTLDIATVPTGQFTRTGLAPVGFAVSFAARGPPSRKLTAPSASKGNSTNKSWPAFWSKTGKRCCPWWIWSRSAGWPATN